MAILALVAPPNSSLCSQLPEVPAFEPRVTVTSSRAEPRRIVDTLIGGRGEQAWPVVAVEVGSAVLVALGVLVAVTVDVGVTVLLTANVVAPSFQWYSTPQP